MANIKERKVYEMVSGVHSKTWMYEVYDEPPMYLAKVSWGKIGSNLQSKIFNEAYCHEKEIEKMAKGYKLVESFPGKNKKLKLKTFEKEKKLAPKEEVSTITNEHKFLDLD